jgi:hypothetical protein
MHDRTPLIYQLMSEFHENFPLNPPLLSLTSHFRSNTSCYLLVTLLVTALVHDFLGTGISRGILSALDVFRCSAGRLRRCAVTDSCFTFITAIEKFTEYSSTLFDRSSLVS